MQYVIWGSELSPFSLKVRAMCDYMRVPFDWVPLDRGERKFFLGLRTFLRFRGLLAGRLPLTYPELGDLGEFPGVPFMFTDRGDNLYDSTAFAEWLDEKEGNASRRLIPTDPLCEFVARLIDEHFDEFHLYVAHHMRWNRSVQTNDAGLRIATEFYGFLPRFLLRPIEQWFRRRQIRRMPYLFGVAPPGYSLSDWPRSMTPPSPAGFPPTAAFLDDAFTRMLSRVEEILGARPFLFGSRFTLADASVYGQLAINRHDADAERIMVERAPTTVQWLLDIENGAAHDLPDGGEPKREDIPLLHPLLEDISDVFVPLMEQNEAAYIRYAANGQTLFNEKAFNAGEALYDGELLGTPFRAVAKTFQVAVWRRLKNQYANLDADARAQLPPRLCSGFDKAVSVRTDVRTNVRQ